MPPLQRANAAPNVQRLLGLRPYAPRSLSQPPFPRPSPRGTPVSRALPPPAARVQTARHRSTPCAAAHQRGCRTARRAPQAPWARHGRWRIALGGRQRKRPFGIPIHLARRMVGTPSLRLLRGLPVPRRDVRSERRRHAVRSRPHAGSASPGAGARREGTRSAEDLDGGEKRPSSPSGSRPGWRMPCGTCFSGGASPPGTIGRSPT